MASRLEDQRAGHCRHCGEKLPLIKRVKREEFCSDEHRERFLNSNQSVALDRLRETGSEMGIAVSPASRHSFDGADTPAFGGAQTAAVAEAEPPDPPMAGTMRPAAVDAPFRMLTFFDGGENRIGQWEPVRPEPQWHSLALHFGLAEFYEQFPAPDAGPASELEPAADPAPNAPAAAPVFPRNEAPPLAEPAPTPDELAAAERLAEQAVRDAEPIPASVAGRVPLGIPASMRIAARRVAPVPEPVEIDTMLYLPGFSPQAEMQSLGRGAWGIAGWLDLGTGAPPPAAPPSILRTQDGEPIAAEIALALPIETGCAIEPAAEPELPAFVAEAESTSFENLMEDAGAPTVAALAVERVGEERGMSEAVQSRADQNRIAGLQSLGARIANPFLHEAQPRPGTAKPRWLPATMTLGTGAPMATEDWDIL